MKMERKYVLLIFIVLSKFLERVGEIRVFCKKKKGDDGRKIKLKIREK